MMRVQKRGTRGFETVHFDKITARICRLADRATTITNEDHPLDLGMLTQKTVAGLYDGISTSEIDAISARIADSHKFENPDYGRLAASVVISNLHKNTPAKFSSCMELFHKHGLITDEHFAFIVENASELDAMIVDENDYDFDYLGYKTLERSYLRAISEVVLDSSGRVQYVDKNNTVVPYSAITMDDYGATMKVQTESHTYSIQLQPRTMQKIIDRPQYMYMRVAIAILKDTPRDGAMALIKEYYLALSNKYFIHATPTLFNACAPKQQLGSCFILTGRDDTGDINRTLGNCALISKESGGIGVSMHHIRPANSEVRGTNGVSSGLIKQIQIYDKSAVCWDQGGRRKGAWAIYLEMWHGDIVDFLDLKRINGNESMRARNLFYGLWVCDLFVKRLKEKGIWSLFNSDKAPGLADVYDGMEVCEKCNFCHNAAYAKYISSPYPDAAECSHVFARRDAFTELYEMYERRHMAIHQMPASELADKIFASQRESGGPYVCHKDHVNRMSNQSGIGTIKGSNLCTEIMEYHAPDSYATCTLASINLRKYLVKDTSTCAGFLPGSEYYIDHKKLHAMVCMVTRGLDRVIDLNHYPVSECVSNSRGYRPIGIGIQALANVFAIMRIPFLSDEAARLEIEIMETIYHASIITSCELAQELGPHEGFAESPAARGLLHFDLWRENQVRIGSPCADATLFSGRYDWGATREMVMKHGLRHSLRLAPMPTVTTSQIMGNNESFEPFTSNIYTKKTLAAKFSLDNTAMIRHLQECGLWTDHTRMQVMNNGGSLANVRGIPIAIKEIYKTVYEMSQYELMKRATIRGAFIDQSQSLNIYLTDNSDYKLRSVFIAGWELGLKTGSYYVRTGAAADPMKTNTAAMSKFAIIETDEPECTNCSS